MNVLNRFLSFLSLIALPELCMADNLQFTATLLTGPPCVINSGRLISVSFGDVQTSLIDGTYKTLTIPYTLDCAGAGTNLVRMQVSGNGASFADSVLAIPGNPEVGIRLLKDGSRLALNTWADFNTSKKPLLEAVLAPKYTSDSTVKAGAFSASATLMVDYR